ncbi:unnamed protein product [Echinostoma caproni]|uniref:DHC_N2 domain-containing protein n=1 Tax=Echinostoma caproni TaxID=27848 RepID=A0A183AP56_9TREM|nr:unnamed protein product [Echinostoma caproni]
MINTENAWIEPTIVHLHFDMELTDPSLVLRILAPEEVALTWTVLEEAATVRESHLKICREISRYLVENTKL